MIYQSVEITSSGRKAIVTLVEVIVPTQVVLTIAIVKGRTMLKVLGPAKSNWIWRTKRGRVSNVPGMVAT